MINDVQRLKLAKMTIQAIESVISGKESQMSTGMGKIIAVENAISRYKFYELHPEQIPPHIMEVLEMEKKFSQ